MSKKLIAIFCALTMVFTQIAAVSVSAADKTAPALRAATPKMNSTGISTTVKISLKFSENLYKSKYFTKIKLAKSSGSAVTITRSIYKNYLKIGHKYALSYSTTYYLTIPAYSVKDKAGNILKKKIVVKFKTKAKPVTPSPSPVVTPTPTATPTATPLSGSVNVTNDAELTAALASSAVTDINLSGGPYAGFTISNPVIINGAGADITSGITINASNVTINNLDVTASTSLVSVPEGDMEMLHGYSIAVNLTGVTISGGSITGPDNTTTKGIYFLYNATVLVENQVITAAESNNSVVTVTNVNFTGLRNGLVCNGAASLTVTGCTFSGCRVGIGSTEFTTLTNITTNSFTNAPVNVVEGIGLGEPVTYTGQADLITFMLANNTWDGTYVSGSEAGNRINDYRTTDPATHY